MSEALVLVSNRGPVTYQEDGSVKRGTGGLATALIGLASHRDAVWIASTMTDADVDASEQAGGRAFEVEAPEGGTYHVRFVASTPRPTTASTTSSPTRCSGSSSTTSGT
jgi:trehalose 6-phosphate synthase